MNAQRRKALGATMDKITGLVTVLGASDLAGLLSSIAEELDALRDEEQDYYDNMPESLQNGDKGQTAEQAAQSLTEAHEALTALHDALDEFDPDDVLSKIEDARGMA